MSQATVRPTKKQRELLNFIAAFITEHGYSPSYREIMNGLNYTSVATVSLHVNNLIRRGHLLKRDHSARSLEVVKTVATEMAPDKPSEWLMDKIAAAFTAAEAVPTAEALADLGVLVKSLQILGYVTEAEPLVEKLDNLRLQKPVSTAKLPLDKA